MVYKKYFDFNSAYGQLIILVFLPICVLAGVGAILVFYETMRASHSEQSALANATLIRYQPKIQALVPVLLEQEKLLQKRQSLTQEKQQAEKAEKKQILARINQRLQENDRSLQQQKYTIHQQLDEVQSAEHLQRVAVLDESGKVLAVSGVGSDEIWGNDDITFIHKMDSNKQSISELSTPVGTAYGTFLGEFDGRRLWLLVDMDNEPLEIACYRILLALSVTGLFTILLLLLSLNGYARRWIAPIYEIRLFLRQMDIDNLHEPMPSISDGELSLLRQDLVMMLRRLNTSFQELKNHAEQAEDDLRQAFDEMEMQNISIRNARDAAILASQTKSAFLANISHELRTPLNSIDGFINLLARHENLSAQQDLYVQTIRKSSAHLLALVNDVLDFSKIEAGKLVLNRHQFDLYDAIYDVMDMLSPVSAEKGLRMAVLFYDDVPIQMFGDTLRIKQILTNLVGNAIKFTDSGEVVVRVSLDEQKDNYLMIAVQDSGKGVSESNQKLLFQSFSQGDPSITRQYGGTGLGLVISKQLTRLMGGDIGFYDNAQENIANQGSTFWFNMPAQVNVDEVETGDSICLPILAPLANSHDEFHILAWINHSATMQVLKASLQSLPIQLTQAYSLAGVLEWLKEHGNRWHWVIIDADGEEDMTALLRQIRLHYQGKLAIFGYQVGLDRELLKRYHAAALYEPLDKRQLYQMLDTQQNIETPIDTPRWQGFTVLAVDDHLPNLLVLEALLSELGIDVLTANSGFDAIEIISRQQVNCQQKQDNYHKNSSKSANHKPCIDLVFMDIQMPRMSGHEAAQQIRKIENPEQRIPIVALTAHSQIDEQDNLKKSGIDDYVGKPISQSQLFHVLQKWLGHNRQQVLATQQTQTSNKQVHTNKTSPDLIPSTNLDTANNKPLNKILNSVVLTPVSTHLHLFSPLLTKENGNLIYIYNLKYIKNHQANKPLTQQATEQTIDTTVIDWQDALTRSANKPELASKLIMMMIDSIPDEKTALVEAWAKQDRQALAQIAHRILGASRYTGVPELRQASQNFEDKCLLNVQHTSPAQFAMLKPSYLALQKALDNLQNADLSVYPQLKYHRLKEDDMTWKMI